MELSNNDSKKVIITSSLDTTNKVDTGFIKKPKLNNDTKISLGKMIQISSGQITQCTEVKIKGLSFDLILNGGDTTYLATKEKQFKTPEGFSIGMLLSELPKEIQDNLTKESGWAYYYKLPSKWTLGFCEGNSCTDKYPNSQSKVKWIFQRKLK